MISLVRMGPCSCPPLRSVILGAGGPGGRVWGLDLGGRPSGLPGRPPNQPKSKGMESARHTTFPTDLGAVTITARGERVTGLYFEGHEPAPRAGFGPLDEDELLSSTRRQVEEYLAGGRREFDLPLEPLGTEFQMRVWEELQKIPYGQAISYQELAQRVGSPKGFRAVGSANGKNPISIIIPCHRVIQSNRTLGGYGGGLPIKAALLRLEGTSFVDPRQGQLDLESQD